MLAGGSLLFFLAAAVPETVTQAGPKPVEVQFEGPAGCSSANAFFASLRSRTSQVRAAEGDETRTTLQVRLTRDRARVLGELRTIDDSGATDTRKVQGANCNDVVQALSLTAALALDPSALLSVSPEPPSADEASPANASGAEADTPTKPGQDKPPAPSADKRPEAKVEKPAEPAPPANRTESPFSRPVPGVELGAELVGLSLLSGELSPGFAVEVRKNLGSGGFLRPAVGLAFLYARNDVLATPENAAVGLIAAAASLCPLRVEASVLTLQPCATLWAGMLGSAGRQLTQERSVNRSWLSTGLTLRLLAQLGHGLALQAEGGFQALLLKRRYFATIPSNVIAETPALSPVVGLGLTYGF